MLIMILLSYLRDEHLQIIALHVWYVVYILSVKSPLCSHVHCIQERDRESLVLSLWNEALGDSQPGIPTYVHTHSMAARIWVRGT